MGHQDIVLVDGGRCERTTYSLSERSDGVWWTPARSSLPAAMAAPSKRQPPGHQSWNRPITPRQQESTERIKRKLTVGKSL